MYTLISGSPKVHTSNSLYFLNIVGNHIDEYKIYELKKDKYNDIIQNIEISDSIVLAFPLYVDSPTSITLEFLDYIVDNDIDIKGKKVYSIINCGFREGEQNITAANIIKRWCEKTGTLYCGSILIGAGEIVGKSKYKFISTKALKQLNSFSLSIKNKIKCEDKITTLNIIGNKVYCFLANNSWTKKCKINGLSKESILNFD